MKDPAARRKEDRADDDADRRGEHSYPPDPHEDAERPSQQERDDLKSRLERRS